MFNAFWYQIMGLELYDKTSFRHGLDMAFCTWESQMNLAVVCDVCILKACTFYHRDKDQREDNRILYF